MKPTTKIHVIQAKWITKIEAQLIMSQNDLAWVLIISSLFLFQLNFPPKNYIQILSSKCIVIVNRIILH